MNFLLTDAGRTVRLAELARVRRLEAIFETGMHTSVTEHWAIWADLTRELADESSSIERITHLSRNEIMAPLVACPFCATPLDVCLACHGSSLIAAPEIAPWRLSLVEDYATEDRLWVTYAQDQRLIA